MGEFFTLFKYEMKKQFPAIFQKGKKDIVGFVLSLIFTLAIVGVCIFLMTIISQNYVAIKIDKVFDNMGRAYELLNLFYNLIIVAMVFICVERMRKSFGKNDNERILLCLPVKQRNLFLSRLTVLLIVNYITALFLVLPINIIIYVVLRPSAIFWLSTVIIWIVLPIIVMMIASLIVIPYIKLVDFLKSKYVLLFIVLTILVVSIFLLYTFILGMLRNYLETGMIKFLFNENFINIMGNLLKYTYPANCLAGIALGQDMLKSYLVVFGFVVLSAFAIYYITNRLYYVALYKNKARKIVYKRVSKVKSISPMASLIRKEFISVFREPRHMFSYFVIATAMPVMTYCCYTLIESLIFNMLGTKLVFELAILVMLMFSVLTNTFCATNVAREGKSLLQQKTLPVKASALLGSKIIFCSIVSVCSVILSGVMLMLTTSVNVLSGIGCILITSLFSLAQIFLATKIDLKNTKIAKNIIEEEKQGTKTIARVVALGFVIAIVVGIGCVVLGLLSNGFMNMKINACFVYIFPSVLGAIYLALSIWYYMHNIQKNLDKVVV